VRVTNLSRNASARFASSNSVRNASLTLHFFFVAISVAIVVVDAGRAEIADKAL
jgi:hypothetical protein